MYTYMRALYQCTLGKLNCHAGGWLFAGKMRLTKSLTMLDPFQRHYGPWIALMLCLPAICGEVFWTASILAALGEDHWLQHCPFTLGPHGDLQLAAELKALQTLDGVPLDWLPFLGLMQRVKQAVISIDNAFKGLQNAVQHRIPLCHAILPLLSSAYPASPFGTASRR